MEARTPLTDIRMAEFAATVPWQTNLRQNAETGVWGGKHMLKTFLGKYFDRQFLDRRKGGFSLPLQHWFSEGGSLRQELKDRLLLGTARIHRYLRPDVVKQLVAEPVQKRKSAQTLWQLLFLENWLEHVHEPAISKRMVETQ